VARVITALLPAIAIIQVEIVTGLKDNIARAPLLDTGSGIMAVAAYDATAA